MHPGIQEFSASQFLAQVLVGQFQGLVFFLQTCREGLRKSADDQNRFLTRPVKETERHEGERITADRQGMTADDGSRWELLANKQHCRQSSEI